MTGAQLLVEITNYLATTLQLESQVDLTTIASDFEQLIEDMDDNEERVDGEDSGPSADG
jgi:hypothetical protein